MMITLYTALAQNEIRNMSENIKWGYTQRFMNGETPNNYKYFYGFHVENGELKINEEEASVVRNIFDWYLEGKSLHQIKALLEKEGIRTASGGNVWYEKVIQGMLCNEKYAGDSMLQKTYTEDFLVVFHIIYNFMLHIIYHRFRNCHSGFSTLFNPNYAY